MVTGWARGWAAVNQGRLTDAAAIWERSWGTAHELADPYLGWMPVNAAALVSNAYLLDPRTARSWCRRGLGQPRFTAFDHPHGTVVDQLSLALAALGEIDAAHEAAARPAPGRGRPPDADLSRRGLGAGRKRLGGGGRRRRGGRRPARRRAEHPVARSGPARPRRSRTARSPRWRGPWPSAPTTARCRPSWPPGPSSPSCGPSIGRSRPRSTWRGASRSCPAERIGADSSGRSSSPAARSRRRAATTARADAVPGPRRRGVHRLPAALATGRRAGDVGAVARSPRKPPRGGRAAEPGRGDLREPGCRRPVARANDLPVIALHDASTVLPRSLATLVVNQPGSEGRP